VPSVGSSVAIIFCQPASSFGRSMGIGLCICRSVIEVHGGRIAADNNSAHGGARYFFTRPIATMTTRTLMRFDP
jgi:K+-sensing histidine kinase KdpD